MFAKKTFIDPVIEPKESLASNLKAQQLINWNPEQDLKEWILKYRETLGI